MPKLHSGLLKGSLILLIAFGMFNLFNLLFQTSMARLLTLADYGILATLFSMAYILTIFSESIQTVITKYSSNEKNAGRLKNLITKSLKKASSVSLLAFIVYLVISVPLSIVLKIPYPFLFLNGLVIFTAFLSPVLRGIMQGKKQFFNLGSNLVSESVIKLCLAVLFVLLGFGLYGALAGAFLGGVFALAFAFFQLKTIFSEEEIKTKFSGIYDYAKPTFFIMIIITLFFNIDIIIAKLFFSSEMVGAYAVSSILAKIIFWGTQPISKAMFPLSAQKKLSKEKSQNIFFNSFLLVLLLSSAGFLFYLFFPKTIITLFSGQAITQAITILPILGLAMGFLALSNTILLYRLSTGSTSRHYFLIFFFIIEIILLVIFSHNLLEYSLAFLTSSAFLLFGLIIFHKDEQNN